MTAMLAAAPGALVLAAAKAHMRKTAVGVAAVEAVATEAAPPLTRVLKAALGVRAAAIPAAALVGAMAIAIVIAAIITVCGSVVSVIIVVVVIVDVVTLVVGS